MRHFVHERHISCVRCGSLHTPRRQLKGRTSQVCLNSKACRRRQRKRYRYARRTS